MVLHLKYLNSLTKKNNIRATINEINEALIFNKNLIVKNFLDGKTVMMPRSRFNLEKYYN